MDVSTVIGSVAGSAITQSFVGLGIWFLFRRNIDRQDSEVDTLKSTVSELKDKQLTGLQQTLTDLRDNNDDRHEADSKARKVIHEKIEKLVTTDQCRREHDKMIVQYDGFMAATLRLERVSERTDQALKRGEQLMEQIVNVKTDVSALAAHVEDMRAQK